MTDMTVERDPGFDKILEEHFPPRKSQPQPVPNRVGPLGVIARVGVLLGVASGAAACGTQPSEKQPPQPRPVTSEAPPNSPQAKGGSEAAYGYATPTKPVETATKPVEATAPPPPMEQIRVNGGLLVAVGSVERADGLPPVQTFRLSGGAVGGGEIGGEVKPWDVNNPFPTTVLATDGGVYGGYYLRSEPGPQGTPPAEEQFQEIARWDVKLQKWVDLDGKPLQLFKRAGNDVVNLRSEPAGNKIVGTLGEEGIQTVISVGGEPVSAILNGVDYEWIKVFWSRDGKLETVFVASSLVEPIKQEVTEAPTAVPTRTVVVPTTAPTGEVVKPVENLAMVETGRINIDLAGHKAEFAVGYEPGILKVWEKWGIKGLTFNEALPSFPGNISKLMTALLWQDVAPSLPLDDFIKTSDKYTLSVTTPNGRGGFKTKEVGVDQIKRIDFCFISPDDPRLFLLNKTASGYRIGYEADDNGVLKVYATIPDNDQQMNVIAEYYGGEFFTYVMGQNLGNFLFGSMLQIPYGSSLATGIGNTGADFVDRSRRVGEVSNYPTVERAKVEYQVDPVTKELWKEYIKGRSFWIALQ